MDDHASRFLEGIGSQCIPYSVIIDRYSCDLCDWVSGKYEFLLPIQIKDIVRVGRLFDLVSYIGDDLSLCALQNRLKKRVLRRSGNME